MIRGRIAVTGGGGYVGSLLVPKLFAHGYEVKVLDTFWYGRDVLNPPKLRGARPADLIVGDIRNERDVNLAFAGCDTVIHLACISNDPSFEMNPGLGKAINYDAFAGILRALKRCNVKQFIYASSSSVYGVKDIPNVTEETPCDPISDYSKFKLMCEEDLKSADIGNCKWTIVRPATVCGYTPRMRLDLIINALSITAIINKKIHVHGGGQLRPNVNVRDMVRAYLAVLDAPIEKTHGQTFNVGAENLSVNQLAKLVQKVLSDPAVEIVHEPVVDPRSYQIDSSKILRDIGFSPSLSFDEAIMSILLNYNKMRNPLTNPMYYNIKRMKQLGIA